MGHEDRTFDDGTGEVIGALIEVHRFLGPGLLESAYEACLCAELRERGIPFEEQQPVAVEYKGTGVECSYRLDVVVRGKILIELKTVDRLLPIHEAQVITYLRLTRIPVALLVNFNSVVLRAGLRRLTLNPPKRRKALPFRDH